MTIDLSFIAVDLPIRASDVLQLAKHVNGQPGRQVFTASGLFTVPDGAHQLKVTLCGGGGEEQAIYYVIEVGGDSPYGHRLYKYSSRATMCSKIITGLDIGSTVSVTVGAATAGMTPAGATSFGALLTSNGAPNTDNEDDMSSHTGTLVHDNRIFCNNAGVPYGTRSLGGICVVEW